jgi:hypothetical protein
MYNRNNYQMKDSTYDALIRYAKDRIRTGDFLYSVLTSDLFASLEHADEQNKKDLFDICKFVYNELPAVCWGSREKVSNWLKED